MRAKRARAASGLLFCCVLSHLHRGPEAHRGAVAERGHAETSVGQLAVLSPDRRKAQHVWRGSRADVLPWASGQEGSTAQKPEEAAGCSDTPAPSSADSSGSAAVTPRIMQVFPVLSGVTSPPAPVLPTHSTSHLL